MADIASLIKQIAKRNGLTAAQTRALLATARVESGLNPRAVGDNGTSYGLFQHHVGGAGGSSRESARRFLDPTVSINERAKWFKRYNIVDGAGAAALQRPADPAGYAKKVNAYLRGGSGGLNAPVSGGAAPSLGLGEETDTFNQFAERRLGLASARERLGSAGRLGAQEDAAVEPTVADPGADLIERTSSLRSRRQTFAQPVVAEDDHNYEAQSAGPAVSGDGVSGYKDILALGKKFGLRIDGSNQTTGGKHAPGSYHYRGMAVDFGDAKNDPAKLRALASWARRNHGRIKEFFFDPLGWYIKDGKIIKGSIGGHGDHVHIAM